MVQIKADDMLPFSGAVQWIGIVVVDGHQATA